MSAAHPTTQPAATASARGGKPSRAAKGPSLEDASDLKALHTKYSSSVKTLKELFPDWAEDDLLFALEETDGDLEDTINHIAEGHAAKWGEVKSRKEKRQTPKPKPHLRDEAKPFDKSSHVPRPASFRGGIRGGAARGGRGAHSHAGARAKPAPVAAAPAPSAGADEGSGWDLAPAADSKSTDSWGAPSGADAAKPVAATPAAAAPANDTAAAPKGTAMSWANIAKRGAKQVSPEAPKPSEVSEDAAVPAAETKPLAEEPWPTAEPTDATGKSESVAEPAVVESTPANDEPVTAASEAAEESVDRPTTPEPVAQETPAAETQVAQPSPKKPASNLRRLNQDMPVVMPSGNSTVERIGVQFGSLSIGGVEVGSHMSVGASAVSEKPAAEPVAEPATAQADIKEPPQAAAVAAPKAEAPSAVASAPMPVPIQAQPAAAESVAAAQQGPLTTYLQQQQQHQQHHQHQHQQHHHQQHHHQQPHAPAQAHPNASASAIGQMPVPNDYAAAALYGVDAQRSQMGFYDNYGYGQFVAAKDGAATANPAAADSRTPATSGPQAAAVSASANLGQAGLFPQQVPQPFGMPYYNPYYYNMMQPGGQYHNPAFGNNPALAAAYGQPFMKQGMYPMYPGATPQNLQAVGSQQPQQQGQQVQQQQGQQPQQPQQQQAPQGQQQQQQQQQAGAKGPGVGGQNNTAPYGNMNAQKPGNPYGHYAANIGSGFGVYEQDPAVLSHSPQQYGIGGIPGILSGAKSGGKDAGGKGIHPAGTAPVIGGTTYYSTPQQLGGYPSQANSSHPQSYSHQQQAYYNPYAPTYGQTQAPHAYQQQQQQHPPQPGHQQANKQYWEKQ
ncbi:RNAPII degradation factor [Coemansia biformis]|uniref:RNA polymerase II degradation factor 1 n=1 Tax=Coemansia biformis TaxID=1286918 RepID=A0A9W8D0L9_9FUNG|nr:RNAPII degradation factor [Coemansia biformis]